MAERLKQEKYLSIKDLKTYKDALHHSTGIAEIYESRSKTTSTDKNCWKIHGQHAKNGTTN